MSESRQIIDGYLQRFEYYRELGEKAMLQLRDEDIYWQSDEEANSIAIIVKHLSGNMLSRWTDFLNSDGEKEWRNREEEFSLDIQRDRKELLLTWNKGWSCLLEAIRPLTDSQINDTVYIRNQAHTVQEALNRQLAHYAYHVGQIVLIARQRVGKDWQSLSIPRGGSAAFNEAMFSSPKQKKAQS